MGHLHLGDLQTSLGACRFVSRSVLDNPIPPPLCVVFVGWWLTTSAHLVQVDAGLMLAPLIAVLGPEVDTSPKQDHLQFFLEISLKVFLTFGS